MGLESWLLALFWLSLLAMALVFTGRGLMVFSPVREWGWKHFSLWLAFVFAGVFLLRPPFLPLVAIVAGLWLLFSIRVRRRREGARPFIWPAYIQFGLVFLFLAF